MIPTTRDILCPRNSHYAVAANQCSNVKIPPKCCKALTDTVRYILPLICLKTKLKAKLKSVPKTFYMRYCE